VAIATLIVGGSMMQLVVVVCDNLVAFVEFQLNWQSVSVVSRLLITIGLIESIQFQLS